MSAILILLLVAALVGLHFTWRRRLQRVENGLRSRIEALEQQQDSRIQHLQSRIDVLLENMTEGVLFLDAEGRIRKANGALRTMFGIQGVIEGSTLIEALRQPDVARVAERVRTGETIRACELKLPGMPERWLVLHGARLRETGGPPGVVLIIHDLTRLKILERNRNEFVANVSHELRTPLSLIKGYAETLIDGAMETPDVARRFLQTIDRSADRLTFLVQDLLTISELESGRISLDLQSVDLRALAQRTLDDLAPRATARQMRLEISMPRLLVRADPGRLQQVVTNLVDNAIKYGKTGGHVTVEAREVAGGLVECAVCDDGPGLPEEAIGHVFERFYRVDKARSREQGGTGLGLAIVKQIIQCHGGRIWVESDFGKGARFVFCLPTVEGVSHAAASSSNSIISTTGSSF
jgi:two-component system phosphate regulon sensor histidine kinase PhoR